MKICTAALLASIACGAGVAHATPITYFTNLSGAAESPPNISTGTGTAWVIYDPDAHNLQLDVVFSGLLGNVTAAHIHCCTAAPLSGTTGVATTTPSFSGFPTGVKLGTYNALLDLTLSTSYNPAFVTAHGGTTAGAEAALVAGLAGGTAYFNIHTQSYAGGEIRGFPQEVAVPEPVTTALLGLGLAAIGLRRRQRPIGRAVAPRP